MLFSQPHLLPSIGRPTTLASIAAYPTATLMSHSLRAAALSNLLSLGADIETSFSLGY